MRLKKVKGADEGVAASKFVIHNAKEHKGKWSSEIFGNDHPLRIEIGMGKGQYITTLSERNPDINYLGIEMFTSVLFRAVEKMEAKEEPNPNLFFLRQDATEILDVFGPEEIDEIYLNFSDPWPKERHAKRRLTSRQFLQKYQQILKKDGVIIFKTDNVDLFNFSLEEIKEAGWTIVNYTYDLHHSEFAEGNIMTEYEEKFSSKGNPICRVVFKP